MTLPDAEADAETLARIVDITEKEFRDRLVTLQSDRGMTRFVEILTALGINEKDRYLTIQACRMWLGVSCPSEACAWIDSPGPKQAGWHKEFIEVMRIVIGGK